MLSVIDFNKPSITDWIQSMGVLFAVVGLIINFIYQRKATNAQLRATKDQIALSKRDFERFLIEVAPNLEFKNVNIETSDAFISISISNQPVIDFQAYNLSEDLIAIDNFMYKPRTFPRGGVIAIGYGIKHQIDIFDEYGFTYEIMIYYKDIMGNSYSQKLTAYSSSATVNFSHPERTLKPEFIDKYSI